MMSVISGHVCNAVNKTLEDDIESALIVGYPAIQAV